MLGLDVDAMELLLVSISVWIRRLIEAFTHSATLVLLQYLSQSLSFTLLDLLPPINLGQFQKNIQQFPIIRSAESSHGVLNPFVLAIASRKNAHNTSFPHKTLACGLK